MAAEWFVSRGGGPQTGPFENSQLKQMAASGQLTGNDLVWKQGMPGWVPASQIKGLIGGSVQRAADPMPAPAPDPFGGGGGAQTFEEEPERRPRRSTSSNGEPWYYTFIEKYAFIFMWIGIVFSGLTMLLIVIFTIIGMAQSSSMDTPMGKIPLPGGIPWWEGLLRILYGLILGAFGAVGSVLAASLMRLLAEMGRTLRGIERKTGSST
jgi:hypothetical protein